jgi:hypothetical protein
MSSFLHSLLSPLLDQHPFVMEMLLVGEKRLDDEMRIAGNRG